MENQKIEVVAVFEKKSFTYKDSGETVEYYACECVINGQKIKLSIPKESRPLLNYLLDNYKK